MVAKMTDEQKAEATKLRDDIADNVLAELYFRWQEEHQFEDFNDYIKIVKKAVEKRKLEFVKMTKEPFGPVIRLAEGICIQVWVTKTRMNWKQVRDAASAEAKKVAPAAKTMYITYVPEVETAPGAFEFKPQDGAAELEAMMEKRKKFWSYAEVARALKVGQKVIVEVREKFQTLDMLLGYGEVEKTADGYIRPRHLMQEY